VRREIKKWVNKIANLLEEGKTEQTMAAYLE